VPHLRVLELSITIKRAAIQNYKSTALLHFTLVEKRMAKRWKQEVRMTGVRERG